MYSWYLPNQIWNVLWPGIFSFSGDTKPGAQWALNELIIETAKCYSFPGDFPCDLASLNACASQNGNDCLHIIGHVFRESHIIPLITPSESLENSTNPGRGNVSLPDFYKRQYCGLRFLAKILWFLNKYKNKTIEYLIWLDVLWKPVKELVLYPDCLKAKTEQTSRQMTSPHLDDTPHRAVKMVQCSNV